MSMRSRKPSIDFNRSRRFRSARSAVAAALRMTVVSFAAVGMVGQMVVATAQAGPLLDKAKAGQTIRIGYANIKPWCYETPEGGMHGFTNEIMLGALKAAGFDKVESVLITDWSGYIPGLQARQYDVASCGLYILGSRCKAVAFSIRSACLPIPFWCRRGIRTRSPPGMTSSSRRRQW